MEWPLIIYLRRCWSQKTQIEANQDQLSLWLNDHSVLLILSCLGQVPPFKPPVYLLALTWVSLIAQLIKNLLAVQETWIRSLGQEDPLQKEMATHSSTLAWKNPMDGGTWWAAVHGSLRLGYD